MRLIFLHGINQDGRDPKELKRQWIADLEAGIGRPNALAGTDIAMPYYGDALVAAASLKSGAIAQGLSESDERDLAHFLVEGLDEQASAVGISKTAIAEEQELAPAVGTVVPQGFPMDRRINAIVSLLERVSPLHGDLALRLLGQAYAYLKNVNARRAVDDIVRPALEGGPAVVVSHSLGTIVGFAALRERARKGHPADVPLFVTIGSPLALSTVQRAIGPTFANPAGVGRWMNLRDPDDLISLNRGLDSPRFAGPIENFDDFNNPGKDPHAIPGYLTCSPIAAAISSVLNI